jgi:large subunit ribosomal protein L31
MQTNIHPKWYNHAQVTCTCGNTFTTGSTQPKIQVDICAKCHPYFTGEMKFVDRQGRVDRFKQKLQHAQQVATEQQAKAQQQSAQTNVIQEEKSYQEILREKQATMRETQPRSQPQPESKIIKTTEPASKTQ